MYGSGALLYTAMAVVTPEGSVLLWNVVVVWLPGVQLCKVCVACVTASGIYIPEVAWMYVWCA